MKKMKKGKEQQSPSEISYNFLTLRLDSDSKKKSGTPQASSPVWHAAAGRSYLPPIPQRLPAMASTAFVVSGSQSAGFYIKKINIRANYPAAPALAC
ncbi:MAG: hypothetical protein M0R48_11785 [Candidatus Omnitrophica bacterium]|nr:hypothetical protein [Candidatus Omnitrophota bacterium]